MMLADMDARGTITLSAETPLEAYALARWTDEALIQQDDPGRREQCHWRGSKLIVFAGPVPKQEGASDE